ncbi:MAG: GNAT family N-acetyltransferase [Paenisporosarcina sp.]
MKLSYQSFSSLSFQDGHVLFNRGFENYLIPMNLTFDAFVGRFGNEGLSAKLSVVAFDENEPIGFVLQGMKEIDGQRISWNGGTGVVPEYRGKKIGVELMKEAERYLVEEGVSIATLEALSDNKPAIKLYEKCGYEVVDDLYFLSSKGKIQSTLPDLGRYEIARVPAFQLIGSNLFPTIVPWQIDASVVPRVGGEAIIISENGVFKGSCLIRKRKVYDKDTEGITLFQLKHTGDDEALNLLLAHSLEFDQSIDRSTYNFAFGDGVAVSALRAKGFEQTPISQVFMTKNL